MLAAGMLIIWGGYSVSLWGWCLLRGYNVTLGQLMTPLHPYNGPWPPGPIPDSQVFPGGMTAAQSAQVGGTMIGASIASAAGKAARSLQSHPPTPSGQPSTAQQQTGGI